MAGDYSGGGNNITAEDYAAIRAARNERRRDRDRLKHMVNRMRRETGDPTYDLPF